MKMGAEERVHKDHFKQLMIRYDITYARNRSLRLDVGIIASTIPALVAQVRELRASRRTQLLNKPVLSR